MSLPMSLPMSFTVKCEGRSTQLVIKSCKIFMAAEFAGNVELSLDCDPTWESIVQDSLEMQVPGGEAGVESIASGARGDAMVLVFTSDAISLLSAVPESLTFRWCGEPCLSVVPELSDSIPIEEIHRLIDPLEILGRPETQTAEIFRLGFERNLIWLLLAAMVLGFGVAASFAPLGMSAKFVPHARLAGGVSLLIGAAMAVATIWFPTRQIWFDRGRREVLLIEGRTLSATRGLRSALRRSVDGFAHVRISERIFARDLTDEAEGQRRDYLVQLEGPTPFAFRDGRVHLRSDSLHLAKFSSERRASRFAAEVGYHVGLGILIATDW